MRCTAISRFLGFLLLICAAPPAQASEWPRLSEGDHVPQCEAALKIAKNVFQSGAFYLYAPPEIPVALGSKLVLSPQAVDISGGDALKADISVFEKVPKGNKGAPRSIYWQSKSQQGFRWVVDADSVGWRGDSYSLFAVDAGENRDLFISKLNEKRKESGLSLVTEGWRPPLLLQEEKSGEIWAIDVGHSVEPLGAWDVYVLDTRGAVEACAVYFSSETRKPFDLLPESVKKFADLMSKTQGDGSDEGTLRPTARIKARVGHIWANIALRPWVEVEAYNTREEVDAGLLVWSKHWPLTQKRYSRIQKQYPVAERDLAKYYKDKFGKSPEEAARLAKERLDVVFRAHFVFAK